MSLPEFDASRRKFLRYGTGVAAGLALSSSHGLGSRELAHFLETSYEYGPEVAHAVLSHPGQSLDAYRLWRGPERMYERSPAFKEKLVYGTDAIALSSDIFGVGDSNMVGPGGTDEQKSILVQFKNMAGEGYGLKRLNPINLARGGSTTETVIKDQVESILVGRMLQNKKTKNDIWVNVGGNDVSNLVQNETEIDELRHLASGPFQDMDLLFKYTERIEGNIQQFEGRFHDLLNSIYIPECASQIRQLVVVSLPDFGKARSIITQEIDNVSYTVELRSHAVRRLVANISILMNNAMFKAVEKFQHEKTEAKVVGIDTYDRMSDFSGSQHYTPWACWAIAQNAASRIELAG